MQRTAQDEAKILSLIEDVLSPDYTIPHCSPQHDVSHIKRVIAIAKRIVDPKEVDLFLLKIVIWMHNYDRSDACNARSEAGYPMFIAGMLSGFNFSTAEENLILDAVLKHNRLNSEGDSPLLRDLKDADRLDEGAIGILRLSGPYERPVPLYTPNDFTGDERSSKEADLSSILHDLDRCLEWEDMLRNPRAKELGAKRFAFMRTFRQEVYRELSELGLI